MDNLTTNNYTIYSHASCAYVTIFKAEAVDMALTLNTYLVAFMYQTQSSSAGKQNCVLTLVLGWYRAPSQKFKQPQGTEKMSFIHKKITERDTLNTTHELHMINESLIFYSFT